MKALFIPFLMAAAASVGALTPAAALKVMELAPHGLGVYVDAYAHGSVQVRVMPSDTDDFYQVEDVVVASPLTASDIDEAATAVIDVKCHVESICQVSVPNFKYEDGPSTSLRFELMATAEDLTVVYKVGGETLSRASIPLKRDSPEAIIEFNKATKLYGIPQHAVDLTLKKDVEYRLYNLDVFHYKLDDPLGIYGSIPFLMAHSSAATVGVLMLNPSDTHVKVLPDHGHSAVRYRSEVGIVNLVFMPGPTPAAVQSQHSHLTGTGFMPPLFSLGHNQCRWNYRSTDDCLDVDAGFDQHSIPYDVLWLDIEHTDGKKYFTWDRHTFPDPKGLIDTIASHGRKMVTITDPHVKREAGYHVHDEAHAKGYYVKNTAGTGDYEGHCWPGASSWVDFYNKDARDWYASKYSHGSYTESTPDLYTWVDMNEPSVFNSHEVTMDKNAIHVSADGKKVAHRYLHNMYGFYSTMSVFDGHVLRSREVSPDRVNRPFILTRSFFAGSQRHAAMWTGDNMGQWDHLRKSLPMLQTLSISNFPFVGADIGGFFFNPDAELMTRWFQTGIFYPFCRAHAHLETKRREPWLFDDKTTALIRDAIVLRYTLLSYLYTCFWKSHIAGAPIIRPLFYNFPKEEGLFDEQDTFMIGDGLLARPVTDQGATSVSVVLPSETVWYDFFTGATMPATTPSALSVNVPVTMASIPIFLRGGAIVHTKNRLRRSSAGMAKDPYTLHVALGRAGTAIGTVFSDDSLTFDYQKGRYMDRTLTFGPSSSSVSSLTSRASPSVAGIPSTADTDYVTTNKVERILIYGLFANGGAAAAAKSMSATARYDAPLRAGLDAAASAVSVGAAAEAVPLELSVMDNGVVLIRRPDVFVDADWTIDIKFEK